MYLREMRDFKDEAWESCRRGARKKITRRRPSSNILVGLKRCARKLDRPCLNIKHQMFREYSRVDIYCRLSVGEGNCVLCMIVVSRSRRSHSFCACQNHSQLEIAHAAGLRMDQDPTRGFWVGLGWSKMLDASTQILKPKSNSKPIRL